MKVLWSFCLGATLVGCAAEDPLTRPGLWTPIGANDANLRVMIADPKDLVSGVSDRRGGWPGRRIPP